eukprot:COSAG02_NODE_5380_length_4381_cov_2.299159_3_plen_72_part_00
MPKRESCADHHSEAAARRGWRLYTEEDVEQRLDTQIGHPKDAVVFRPHDAVLCANTAGWWHCSGGVSPGRP